jgi:hypothetical protein
MTRRQELSIAAAAIGVMAFLAALPFAWELGIELQLWDIFRAPLPSADGWDAFNLYFWIVPVTVILAGPLALLAWLRRVRIAPILAALVCLQSAMLYLPYAASLSPRVDRVRRLVRDPIPEARLLVIVVLVTLTLAAVYGFIARGWLALVVTAVLNGILLQHVWLLSVLPFGGGWWPLDWRRMDRLISFRPCRGAMVWRVDDTSALRFGRIDDVWRQFDDPRTPGPPLRAVSVAGEWQHDYIWLTAADMAAVRVRSDDPAVVRCDSAARPEPVAPADWHHVGLPPQ